jgi:hypothetical protein
MVSDDDARWLQELETRLAVDDADFVAAFRNGSGRLVAPTHRGGPGSFDALLVWLAAGLLTVLLVGGIQAVTAGTLLLMLTAVMRCGQCRQGTGTPHQRSRARRRRRVVRNRGSA